MENDKVQEPSPKVFVSYRWTSPAHEEWVLRFATSLRSDGVNIILDKWHLQEGQDTLAFMEQMVSDPTMSKVLLVCDKEYVDRANARTGGVGTEAQIVSASVYEKTDQNKVAAIVTELNSDGKPYLPIYMSTRLYFDMSSSDSEAVNYEKVLRWIFGKPFHALPPLGESPKFLEKSYASGTSFARTSNRQTSQASGMMGRASDLLNLIAQDATSFIENLSGKPDPENLAYEGIKSTFPVLENLYLALTDLVSEGSDKSSEELHIFFEKILKNWDFRPNGSPYTRIDNDAYQFFCQDAFISFVAICMQNRRFDFARSVISTPFFKPGHDQRTGGSVSYSAFLSHLESLEHRNRNQNLRRLSLKADLMHEKHEHSIVTSSYFMEADITLFLRGHISGEFRWFPDTSVYLEMTYGSLPTYARATSSQFYEKFKTMIFDISSGDLKTLVPKIDFRSSSFRGIDLPRLLNVEKIASLP